MAQFDKDVRMAELELDKIKVQSELELARINARIELDRMKIELAQITTANPHAFDSQIELEKTRSKNLATQLEIAKLNSYSGFNSFLIGKF